LIEYISAALLDKLLEEVCYTAYGCPGANLSGRLSRLYGGFRSIEESVSFNLRNYRPAANVFETALHRS
jgi:hypothetical protein